MFFRLIFIFVLAFILFKALKTIFSLPHQNRENIEKFPEHSPAPEDEMVKDPQCKTYVSKNGSLTARIGGKKFYFCSNECLERYKKERGND